MTEHREVRVFPAAVDLFQAAAEEFAHRASIAVESTGRFSVALSGGSTPKGLYSLLASGSIQNIPWDRIYFFWSDERHVPPDHSDSNFKMAYETLLSKISARPENIFRIESELDAELAAKKYEQVLIEFFRLKSGEFPNFDLILLGLGPDGHTASLFPDTSALNETNRLVVANWIEKLKTERITFTFPVLNHAKCVMFLVTGSDKVAPLREVFEKGEQGPPAGRVHPVDGKLLWFLDSEAASELHI
jgi:6-phosphogluconolactonase